VAAAGPGPVHLDLVDMADPGAVMDLATALAERYETLTAVIHNAGALDRTYRTTAAGVEQTVATHVLGPYLLTAMVAPLLWRRPPATIVTVSSGGMYAQRFDLDQLEMERPHYDGVVAYARAKRAQVVLADAWARRFAPGSVASFAMHPGWVDTPGLEAGLPRFRTFGRPLLRTPAEGADTAVWLAAGGPAADASVEGGPAATSGFFHDRRVRRTDCLWVRHPTHPVTPCWRGARPAPGSKRRFPRWCREGRRRPVPEDGQAVAVPGRPMAFTSMYSSKPSTPFSRPRPDWR